jgi:hypothetical protein
MKRFLIVTIALVFSMLVFSQASAQVIEYTLFNEYSTLMNGTCSAYSWDTRRDGNAFHVNTNGIITRLGFLYINSENIPISATLQLHAISGDASGEFFEWTLGNLLAEGTAISSGDSGWVWIDLQTPIQVNPDTVYFISMFDENNLDYSCKFQSISGSGLLYAQEAILYFNNPIALRGGSQYNSGGSEDNYDYVIYPSAEVYPVDVTFEPSAAPPSGGDGALDVSIDFSSVFTTASDFINGLWPILASLAGIYVAMVLLVKIIRSVKTALSQR